MWCDLHAPREHSNGQAASRTQQQAKCRAHFRESLITIATWADQREHAAHVAGQTHVTMHGELLR
jgi:hypothetical protein